jgi:hypothetical protein
VAAFTAEGYYCWQARGSKGHTDVIAVKPHQLVLIQVKGATSVMSHEGWNGLLSLARLVAAVPVVADWPDWTPAKAGPLRLRQITGAHSAGKKLWLAEPFILDRAAEPMTARRAMRYAAIRYGGQADHVPADCPDGGCVICEPEGAP